MARSPCRVLSRIPGITFTPVNRFIGSLKVPKCEDFDGSDFHDFYAIKPVWVGDFRVEI